MKWLVNTLAGMCLTVCATMSAAAMPLEVDAVHVSASLSSDVLNAQRCRLETSARAVENASYVENARLCLVVAPFGYVFDQALETAFLKRVNEAREAADLPPLIYRPELLDAARYHSLDMAANDYFEHSGPDGRNPNGRIEAFDRTLLFDSSRENLAKVSGTGDADQIEELMHTGLMDSPHHLENILAENVTHVAMGVVRRGNSAWLTQVFARQVGELSSSAPLRMSPGEALRTTAALTDWSFRQFVANDGEGFAAFEQSGRRQFPRMPSDIAGDIVLSVRVEKPGEQPNTIRYKHLSGPLVTVVNTDS